MTKTREIPTNDTEEAITARAAAAIAAAPKREEFESPVDFARALIAAAPDREADSNAHYYYFRDLDPDTTPASVNTPYDFGDELIPTLFEAMSNMTQTEAKALGGRKSSWSVFLLGCGLSRQEAASILFHEGLPIGKFAVNTNTRHLFAAALGRDQTGSTTKHAFCARDLVFDAVAFPLALRRGDAAKFFAFDSPEGWLYNDRIFLAAFRVRGRGYRVGFLRLVRTSPEIHYLDNKGRKIARADVRPLAVLYDLHPAQADWGFTHHEGISFKFDREDLKRRGYRLDYYWKSLSRLKANIY